MQKPLKRRLCKAISLIEVSIRTLRARMTFCSRAAITLPKANFCLLGTEPITSLPDEHNYHLPHDKASESLPRVTDCIGTSHPF